MRVLAVCGALWMLTGCSRPAPDPRQPGSASVQLKPLAAPLGGAFIERTVYVPVYSSIYWGGETRRDMVDLAVTLSIRNVSAQHPLVLNYVRYNDSAGKLVREYVDGASELAPLASVEFVIRQKDTAGGPGANFLVNWMGSAEIDEPLIESVMVGQSGNAGISFTSAGRVLKNAPAR